MPRYCIIFSWILQQKDDAGPSWLGLQGPWHRSTSYERENRINVEVLCLKERKEDNGIERGAWLWFLRYGLELDSVWNWWTVSVKIYSEPIKAFFPFFIFLLIAYPWVAINNLISTKFIHMGCIFSPFMLKITKITQKFVAFAYSLNLEQRMIKSSWNF